MILVLSGQSVFVAQSLYRLFMSPSVQNVFSSFQSVLPSLSFQSVLPSLSFQGGCSWAWSSGESFRSWDSGEPHRSRLLSVSSLKQLPAAGCGSLQRPQAVVLSSWPSKTSCGSLQLAINSKLRYPPAHWSLH